MESQGKNDSIPTKPNNKKRLSGFLISVLIMTIWVAVLYWLFLHYMQKNYFVWYLDNGALISIATSFLALVWKGLERQKGLLSWHPGNFLESCFILMSIFFSILAANLAGPLDGLKHRANEPVSVAETLWDGVFSLIMHFMMALIVFGWLLVISPLFYIVTLVTGAPARRSIRDTGIKVIVKEEEYKTTIKEHLSSKKIPKGWIDVSLGTRPFAFTNALNAAVLFLAKILILG